MIGPLDGATLLWLSFALLTLAAVLGIVIVSLPSAPRLPMARRRPGVSAGSSPLASVANATTRGVESLIHGRGGNAATLLERAGVKQPLKDVIVLIGSAMVVGGALGVLLGGIWAGLLALVVVPLLARLWLALMVGRRQSKFANQLDETLQILAGSLRAGYSLPQAVSTVAIEAETPTSEEFARIVNETRVGRVMEEALEDAAVRTKSEDFFWITQAIAINREVGGNLADVLDGVGHTIRQRSQLRGQVKALSAEGKLSAIILIALPFALIFMISLSNPGYVSLLFTHPVGIVLSIIAVLLLIVGALWLRKTVQIKF